MWTEKVHLGEREGLARLERRGVSVAEVAAGRDVGGGQVFLVTGCPNLAQESERSTELWELLKGLKNVDTHLEEGLGGGASTNSETDDKSLSQGWGKGGQVGAPGED